MKAMWAAAVALGLGAAAARGEVLRQVISREDAAFRPAAARLAVGRDGRVYLVSPAVNRSYLLRLSRDGKEKLGRLVGTSARGVAANADGVVATANAHFGRRVTFHSPALAATDSAGDFLADDRVGWDAPGGVEAGASGDFYALDQHRDRVLRLSAAGRVIETIAIPHEPKGPDGLAAELRVAEKAKALYVLTRSGLVHCVGLDGKPRWSARPGVTPGEPNSGGFDVDDDGRLYAVTRGGASVLRYSPAGQPLAAVALRGAPKLAAGEHGYTDLRVRGGELFLKRKHDTELFARYDLATGRFVQAVSTAHEVLTVTAPEGPWTAGKDVAFGVKLTGGAAAPRWRVWLRPIGEVDYRELTLSNGRLRVPEGLGGLYLMKVTPEVRGWQHGAASEYAVRGWVEVRRAGAAGTASVFTAEGRAHFGRGEEVPFTVLLRGPRAATSLAVRLMDGTRPVAEAAVTARPDQPVSLALPAALTAALRPGRYTIVASGAGLTSAGQPVVIGPGPARSPLHFVQYGDYAPPVYPTPDVWTAADLVASHVRRTSRLGINLVVDRLGEPGQVSHLGWDGGSRRELDALARRLRGGSLAAEKGELAPPLLQAVAGYGAAGVDQMAILMANDAGLPLGGKGFDGRKPPQLIDDLTRVTKALKGYPAFRGWSWSSNWWLYDPAGAGAAKSPSEKAAHDAALKAARATGAWDVVLDRVAGYRLAHAVEAQAQFNKALRAVTKQGVTASAAPYRNVHSYPPVTLANVDEADLHAQWEQIAPPYVTPHGVDFYRRPGKRGWAHPEVWNDAGTGEQILPTLFAALMRGADGVGFSGRVPPWGERPEDGRQSYAGTASVYRALGGLLRDYGPWLASLENSDRVAIVCSGRMFRLDEWGAGVMGTHFARVFQAYCACLHAHHPARLVFTEDLDKVPLARFKAVLVVGQTVEMEPELADALKAAKAAGATVFHDGTCRASVVKGTVPLGLSFDKAEKERHMASDDSAYWRMAAMCRADAKALGPKLSAVTPAAAGVDNPEVFVSERRAEEGRYLFVVNNTSPPHEPGQLWRVTLASAARVPVVAAVRLGGKPAAVYDVFAGRAVEAKGGVVQADLRGLHGRVFAILPAAIAAVQLRGPEAAAAGGRLAWSAAVHDGDGRAIRAGVPLRVRLLGAGGEVLDEAVTSSGGKGAAGHLTAPLNAPAGTLTLEATELFSGKTARLSLKSAAAGVVKLGGAYTPPAEAAAKAAASGKEAGASFAPADAAFGPRLRDVALADGGALAVFNAMNWDHNLYAVDVGTGQVRWRSRVGQYFAFSPRPAGGGVAVQGFDFAAAEGYHLYDVGKDGKAERRYALYGLPKRLTHRITPAILNDRINQFAVAPDGGWVASAGDLGLAVWKRGGGLLWSRDWWKERRRTAVLAALGNDGLLVIDGRQATAHEAATGKELWAVTLPGDGEPREARASADGQTCAVVSTADGGRVYVIKGGKLARAIPTDADALDLSPDGGQVAVVASHQLKLYSVADGLRWVLPGDDVLRHPRFAPDGKRLVAASDLGTVYVADVDGGVRLERDVGALAVPCWLPGGDLLLGTWGGSVCRLDGAYKERWRARLQPEAADIRGQLLAKVTTPTTRVTTWGNAAPRPAALTTNLLSPQTALVRFQAAQPNVQLVGDAAALVDGKPAAPAAPWLPWAEVGWFAETSPENYLVIDTFRTRLRVTGITLAEDAARPESWLRDVTLEYWDAAKERWVSGQALLSDAAVHTHVLAKPVEASRFRLALPRGLAGNLRLGEVALHGARLGASHPDVAAKRPVAVLFDEGDDLKETLAVPNSPLTVEVGDGAHAGRRYLSLRAGAAVVPPFVRPFGHALPNWDFEVAAKPRPGQYRYLQFAWKADKGATAIYLQLGSTKYGEQVAVYAGDHKPPAGVVGHRAAASPPVGWQVVRVDLWKVFGRAVSVQAMSLGCAGGAASFDHIVLGRSEKDLAAKR